MPHALISISPWIGNEAARHMPWCDSSAWRGFTSMDLRPIRTRAYRSTRESA